MIDDRNSSFARRSNKYKDHSNFGDYDEQSNFDTIEDTTDHPEYGEFADYFIEPHKQPQHWEQKPVNPQPQQPPQQRQPYQQAPQQNRPAQQAAPVAADSEYNEFDSRPSREEVSASSAYRSKTKRKKREIASWIVSVCLAVAAAFLIRAFVFEIILVDGDSMYPTLHSHERVAVEKVSRYGGLPERGEIIIVEYPHMKGTYVKRVIALPGEVVEVKSNIVYINGIPMQEDYINHEPYSDEKPVTVPEGHVFVMGDNRAHSMDSRTSYVGPIPSDAIIGHALFVIWPLNNIHSIS